MKKKSILLLALSIFVICGCSKKEKITCTQEDDTSLSNIKIESKATIKFKDGYATEFITNQSLIFKDDESAEEYYNNFDNDEGYKIKLEGSKVIFDYSKKIDKEDIKTEENSKEYIKKYLESKNYKCN